MTSDRFDELTRIIAGSASRRQTFKLLVTGAVAGIIGLSASNSVQATACLKSAAPCQHDKDCCSKACYLSGQAGRAICF